MSEEIIVKTDRELPILISNGNYIGVFSHLKLVPYRVTNQEPYLTMFEFWRGNPKKDGPKECAMIVIKGRLASAKSFTLHYYPLGETAQIVEDLNMDKIGMAVENLIGAGFKTAK